MVSRLLCGGGRARGPPRHVVAASAGGGALRCCGPTQSVDARMLCKVRERRAAAAVVAQDQ
eukprot:61497-Prymnesium_polylepis.2